MSLQTFLFMTSSQADTVRGLTVDGHALAPVMTIIPGFTSFVLPLSVLTDNYQQLRNTILAALSQQTLQTSAVFPTSTAPSSAGPVGVSYPSSNLVLIDKLTYKSSWPVGITISVST